MVKSLAGKLIVVEGKPLSGAGWPKMEQEQILIFF
jgi:hypothetical protein